MNQTQASLAQSVELHNAASQQYMSWVRTMLTLCVGSLTGLIALQKQYTPQNLLALYLLWTVWAGLALSIAFAVAILHSESTVTRRLAQSFASEPKEVDEGFRLHKEDLPKLASISAAFLPWTLLIAMASLFAFAVLNTGSEFFDPPVAQTIDTPR